MVEYGLEEDDSTKRSRWLEGVCQFRLDTLTDPRTILPRSKFEFKKSEYLTAKWERGNARLMKRRGRNKTTIK
jgi:hypothetical protein